MKKNKIVIITWFLIVLGIGFSIFSFINYANDRKVHGYDEVDGELQDIELKIVTRDGVEFGSTQMTTDMQVKNRIGWDIRATYQFSFNGESYTGYTFSYNPVFQDVVDTDEEVNKSMLELYNNYKQVKEIKVYVDPNNLSNNFVYKNPIHLFNKVFLIGLSLIAFGVVVQFVLRDYA